MAKKHVFYDKKELILMVKNGSKFEPINLTYEQIKRIVFDKHSAKKLFKTIPSEKIIIYNSKTPEPITYYKTKEKDYFEQYKSDLKKFAEDNKIKFDNNLVS